MSSMTTLKAFLIEYWFSKNRTISDLAKAIGVDQSIVSRWVNGVSIPTVERQIAIAKALGVDSRQIFPETKE